MSASVTSTYHSSLCSFILSLGLAIRVLTRYLKGWYHEPVPWFSHHFRPDPKMPSQGFRTKHTKPKVLCRRFRSKHAKPNFSNLGSQTTDPSSLIPNQRTHPKIQSRSSILQLPAQQPHTKDFKPTIPPQKYENEVPNQSTQINDPIFDMPMQRHWTKDPQSTIFESRSCTKGQ